MAGGGESGDLTGGVVGDAGNDGGGVVEAAGGRGRRGPSQVGFRRNVMLLKRNEMGGARRDGDA